jgi:hypothetical protein
MQELSFAFGRSLERIPLALVWGVHPQDTGSLNSVYEYTDARLDTSTNLTSPESQLWLRQLCANLTRWADEPQGPIVAGSVECPFPMLEEIAEARNLSLPMPPEVLLLCLLSPECHAST